MLTHGWPRFSLTGLVALVLVATPGWHSFAEGVGSMSGTVRPAEHDGSLLTVHVRQTGLDAAPIEVSRLSRDTAFIERSSEAFGTFDGVSFVRYTGIFRGETTLGAFRVPYEIVAPENHGSGNGTVLVEPPPSALLEEAPAGREDPVYGFETGIARDDDLNARGGVRLPDLHLGRARFIASDSTTRPPRVPSRFAFLYGTMVDLACEPAPGSDTDEPRFRAHADYVGAFTRQVEKLQRQGFLLETDAAEMKERSAGSEVGKPGTCDE